MDSLKVGDWVQWESQAGGNWTIKRGTVFEIIPPNQLPKRGKYAGYASGYPHHKPMFDSILSRTTESYLIEVRDGKTDKSMPKLYWPHVSKLKG